MQPNLEEDKATKRDLHLSTPQHDRSEQTEKSLAPNPSPIFASLMAGKKWVSPSIRLKTCLLKNCRSRWMLPAKRGTVCMIFTSWSALCWALFPFVPRAAQTGPKKGIISQELSVRCSKQVHTEIEGHKACSCFISYSFIEIQLQ